MQIHTKKSVSVLLCLVVVLSILATGITGLRVYAITSAEMTANQKIIYNFCVNTLGYNCAAACGILGNIEEESHFDPHNVGDDGDAYGICQWNSRRVALISWCTAQGLDYTDLNAQLKYMEYELKGSYSYVHSYLLAIPNTAQGAYDAAYYFCVKFEIPYGKETRGAARGVLARDTYFPNFNGTVVVVGTPTVQVPANGVTLDASNPGNLVWTAVSGAKAYRYIVMRVNASGAEVQRVANNILVSSAVTSVSLNNRINANMSSLQFGSSYKIIITAYIDEAGTTSAGNSAVSYFKTANEQIANVSLLTPGNVTLYAYNNKSYYAGTYSGTVDALSALSVSWSQPTYATYYTVNIASLSSYPSPYILTGEQCTNLYENDIVVRQNSYTFSADDLLTLPGEYLRLKITAHGDVSGVSSSTPAYFYLKRNQKVTAKRIVFNPMGGTMEKTVVRLLDTGTVTMPVPESGTLSIVYDAQSGRCAPGDASYLAVFEGWGTTENATAVKYKGNTAYNVKDFAETTNLYAVWKTFITLSNTVPVRSGYTFKGWQYEDANGTQILHGGEGITLYGGVGKIVLTAVWERDASKPVIVSAELDGVPGTKQYTVGDELDLKGLRVLAQYSDGSSAIITEGLTVTDTKLTGTGFHTVCIDCEGQKLYWTVYVLEDKSLTEYDVGDLNLDSSVDSADARLALRYAVGLEKECLYAVYLGDVGGDGKIGSDDARLILRSAVGLEDTTLWARYTFNFNY